MSKPARTEAAPKASGPNKKRGRGRPSIDRDGGLTWSITIKFPDGVRAFVDEVSASQPLKAPSNGQIIRDLVAEAIEARRRAAVQDGKGRK